MKNKQTGFFLFIIVVAILIIGAASFYYFKYQKSLTIDKQGDDILMDNKQVKLVEKVGNKLILQLDNGDETILQDVLGETDIDPRMGSTENQSADSRFYTFDKLYEDINQYGVNVGYYVGMDSSSFYLLINKKNGNQVSLVSNKISISPNKHKVVSYNSDLLSGFSIHGFDIINLDEEGNFRKEYHSSPTNWGPSNVKWTNDSELEFERTVPKGDNDEEIQGVVKYKLISDKFGNDSWVEIK